MRALHALLFTFLMLSAPLSGCFGTEEEKETTANDLVVEPGVLSLAVWQEIELYAQKDLAVFIPHMVNSDTTFFIQNSTVLNIRAGDSIVLQILPPPAQEHVAFLVGEYGRTNWPVRQANESWSTWVSRGGNDGAENGSIMIDNSTVTLPTITSANSTGGMADVQFVHGRRLASGDIGAEQGAAHANGWVNGREVYNWMDMITDETPDPLDLADGAKGYLDRWIGNGNPAYEDAITFFSGVFEGYGLRVVVHRFQAGTVWAVNICGYKDGLVFPDEWLVFGGHFDIAPPAAYTPGPDIPGYGTRVGAYDNTAGSSMIMTTAGALSQIDSRRTMVFCLWSSEEEGLWGSDSWTKDIDSDVTVTNYLNLDMASINYPGNYALSTYIGPEIEQQTIDQPEMFYLAEWIGAGPLNLSYQMERGHEAWLEDGESGLWENQYEDTVAIYESPTARSDHESFQANLGTITMGWNGVVDGYPCYHRNCDTLSQVESYMVTESATGEQNLVHSLDIVTWWATYCFMHMDEKPVLNALS